MGRTTRNSPANVLPGTSWTRRDTFTSRYHRYDRMVLTLQPDLPRVETARVERALVALDRAIGGSKVLSSREVLERFSRDESETVPSRPDGAVLATTADDIAACLRICEEHEVPVTPRGAGSGKTGGSV